MSDLAKQVSDALVDLAVLVEKLTTENQQLRSGQTIVQIRPAAVSSNAKKLSAEDAHHIRALKRSGYTQAEISRAYDINKTTVSRIVRGIYHK